MWTAERIVRAIERNAAVTTIGSVNRLLRRVGRHAGGIADAVAARQVVAPQHTIGDTTHPPGMLSTDGRRHCVVTGGANGIGRAVVERYARDGWLVTIIDREAPQINRAIQDATTFIHADLAHSEGIDRALRHLAALPAADVVVQSAGINAVGAFAASAIDEQLTVLDVNLRAPLHLTAGLLHFALLAPRATLVFIASLSVYTGYPGAAVYAASKDGLSSYARSLRVALAHRHMNVITVYPGPTRTAHARRYSPDNRRESRRMAPERVAACIAAAVERRRARVIPGITNQAVALIGSVAPTLTMYAMRKTIFERLEALSGDVKAERP
jgi:short-subunit dehydrogenase